MSIISNFRQSCIERYNIVNDPFVNRILRIQKFKNSEISTMKLYLPQAEITSKNEQVSV